MGILMTVMMVPVVMLLVVMLILVDSRLGMATGVRGGFVVLLMARCLLLGRRLATSCAAISTAASAFSTRRSQRHIFEWQALGQKLGAAMFRAEIMCFTNARRC